MFKMSSGLQRFWIRSCLLVTALLLAELGGATVFTAHASEKDDVKTLLQLENDMAQAWVQRDTQTLERILADDYTLGGTGDFLIDKEAYVAGLDNPEFRTTAAIVDHLRIRVYATQPSLQVALFTEVGLKREESTFAASGLLIPSSAVVVFGNVLQLTLQASLRPSPRGNRVSELQARQLNRSVLHH
jgi:hypothetical protein